MAMLIEKWLDRREPVKEGEAAFSEEARERIYRRPKFKKVAVPKGSIVRTNATKTGEAVYSVRREPVTGAKPVLTIMPESEVGSDTQVVDVSLLGEPGNKYDEVFDEIRTEAATARYDRIHKKARRYRLGAAVAAVTMAAVAVGFFHGSVPEFRFVPLDDCSWSVDGGLYIELERSGSEITPGLDEQQCTFEGQTYQIRLLPDHPVQ